MSSSNTLFQQQQVQMQADLSRGELDRVKFSTPVNYSNPAAQGFADMAYNNAVQTLNDNRNNAVFQIQQAGAKTEAALNANFLATKTKNSQDYATNLFNATVATEMMYSGLADEMSPAYQSEMAKAAPGENVGPTPGTKDYNAQLNNLGNNISWDLTGTYTAPGSTVATPIVFSNSSAGASYQPAPTFGSAFQTTGLVTTDGIDMGTYGYSAGDLGIVKNIDTLLKGGNLNENNFNDWRNAEKSLTPESIEAAKKMSADFARYESAYEGLRPANAATSTTTDGLDMSTYAGEQSHTTDGLDMNYMPSAAVQGVVSNINILLSGHNLNSSNFAAWREAETQLNSEVIAAAVAQSSEFAALERAYQAERGGSNLTLGFARKDAGDVIPADQPYDGLYGPVYAGDAPSNIRDTLINAYRQSENVDDRRADIPDPNEYPFGEHFLSSSIDEGCNAGYAFEEETFRLFDASSPNAKPLYRCFQGNLAQGHSASLNADCDGGSKEGVYGYVLSEPAAGTIPLYRVQFPQSRDALVTPHEREITLPGASNKVILGYVLPPASTQLTAGGY